MTPLKKAMSSILLLLAFAGFVVFISTSIEVNYALTGDVKIISIGYGSPWYQQVSQPSGFSRELNLLAPSFLAGVAGLVIILGHLVLRSKNSD